MKPFFSIIVPVYQAEHTLDRCIQSVLSQEYENYELILVDDGSTDGSAAICDTFAAADPRITVIHQMNSGVSAARNAGIHEAQGEYLLFLDSDDMLRHNALSIVAGATNCGIIDIVISNLSVVEHDIITRTIGVEEDKLVGVELFEEICKNPNPYGYVIGKAFRCKLVSDNNILFNPAMYSQEDLDFFLSVCVYSNSFRLIAQSTYEYFYVPAKRIPPFWDFIANQIKLLQIVNTRTTITLEAKICVYERILSYLYTGLYSAVEDGSYNEIVEKLQRVEGLKELLRSVPAKGEHGFVIRNYTAGRYRVIQRYFVVRNQIRDLVRLIKKR